MDSVIGTPEEHPAARDALAGPAVPGPRSGGSFTESGYVVPARKTEAIQGGKPIAARRLVEAGAEGAGEELMPAAGLRAFAGGIVTWGDRGR
ncbi:hypothetical protein ACIBQ1_15895 [Nonomuraea sp. NPDC050153]|uniref:hypothetical protein n=1 Tax=Nonomuraea sp. NPDC050153 TaxID=3364359 RepID=UPI003796FBF2